MLSGRDALACVDRDICGCSISCSSRISNNKTVKMSVENPHFVLVSCLFFGAGDLFGLQAVKTVLTQNC